MKRSIIRLFLFCLLSMAVINGFAQSIFIVDHFSKEYYGKIFIDDTSQVFSAGWVAIYERTSNKQLIKVSSDELALSLHDGKALANIQSLPYGEQSLIIYEDFNFDGKKDLALEDGQNSCYHGPSFQIYLASPKGFVFDDAFTGLAQNYCGMFQVNYKTKTIFTSTKSGCCWHEFSEFKVVNNQPKAIKIFTEDCSGGGVYCKLSTQTWNGKAMITTEALELFPEGIDTVLTFSVPKNGKRVFLFIAGNALQYALFDKQGKIEFTYPYGLGDGTGSFKFYAGEKRRVVFSNKNATYSVYETSDGIGIDITTGGKTYHWDGEMETRKGSLYKYGVMNFEHVTNAGQ